MVLDSSFGPEQAAENSGFGWRSAFSTAPSRNGTNCFGTERGRSEPVHIASEGEELVRGSQAEPFVCAQATEGSKVESIESMSPFC